MKLSAIIPLAFLSVALYVVAQEKPAAPTAKPTETTQATEKPVEPKLTLKVSKSDEEWRSVLTEEQYRVARTAGTERPHGKAYDEFNAQGEGTYYCVCCASELFTSSTKFHSGCGWPSFYDQSKAKNITEHVDESGGMKRIEVVCKVCDAHLGHVFEGEGFKTPTDRRYCINGVAMTFVEKGGKAPEPKGKPAPEKK
jgi:peptide-methionine (R)-S-oxide reductase